MLCTCVLVHQWLFVMVFSNRYDGFDLLPVGRDVHSELSHEWQQRWTIRFEFCFTWLQDWFGIELLVCLCQNGIGFCTSVYFYGVLLSVDLDGHHSARIFILIFCEVLMCVPLCISFTWGSMDLQTFTKCLFLLQRLQMTLQALQRPVCGTFSLQNLQILIVFIVCFLSSWWMVVMLSIVKYGICSNGISVRVESIVFQLQWLICWDQLGKVHILLDDWWL